MLRKISGTLLGTYGVANLAYNFNTMAQAGGFVASAGVASLFGAAALYFGGKLLFTDSPAAKPA